MGCGDGVAVGVVGAGSAFGCCDYGVAWVGVVHIYRLSAGVEGAWVLGCRSESGAYRATAVVVGVDYGYEQGGVLLKGLLQVEAAELDNCIVYNFGHERVAVYACRQVDYIGCWCWR